MRMSRIWRIMQIEEDVIHRGWRSRWIRSSEICIIFHIIRQPSLPRRRFLGSFELPKKPLRGRLTTAEFNNSVLLFIQNIFQFLTSLLPWPPVDFFLNFGLFFVTVLGYKHIFFFLQILHKSIDSIRRAICFAYSWFTSCQFYSWTSLQRPPWGQKKVTVVERFEKRSMYGVSAKESGHCGDVARLVEVRLYSQLVTNSAISSSGSLS